MKYLRPCTKHGEMEKNMEVNEIIINKKNKCCGCMACFDVCAHKAITIVEDSEGFLQPRINSKNCIQCNLCKKVCPTNKIYTTKSPVSSFALQNKNEEILKNSSSGGVFYEIALYFLQKQNSIVIGAYMQTDGSIHHIAIDKKNDISKLQKSKYAQSDLRDIFKMVREKLNNNYTILFTGTPCQIAALNSFLGKKYENIFCLDFICHGVPNSKLWSNYIKRLGNIKQIDFRNKSSGWRNFSLYVKGDKKNINTLHFKDTYMIAFLKNYTLRESCYCCKFKNNKSLSDITMGDFWGIENFTNLPFKIDLGVSFMQVNTDKGLNLFNEIKDAFKYIEVQNDINKELNIAQYESVKRPPERDYIFKAIYKKGIFNQKVFDKLVQDSISVKIKRRLNKIIGLK